MSIQLHPEQGTIVICDFSGFQSPEMTKKRPAIVVSPRFRNRGNLCTVVPLSTTAPIPVMPYNYRLYLNPVLPEPYHAEMHWVKADMLYTVSFDRLSLPFQGKDGAGKRMYDVRVLESDELIKIQCCVLHGIGLQSLTEHIE